MICARTAKAAPAPRPAGKYGTPIQNDVAPDQGDALPSRQRRADAGYRAELQRMKFKRRGLDRQSRQNLLSRERGHASGRTRRAIDEEI